MDYYKNILQIFVLTLVVICTLRPAH